MDLLFSAVNGFSSNAISLGNSWLQKNIANGFSGSDGLRFYYNKDLYGGGVVNYLVKNTAMQLANTLKQKAIGELKSLANDLFTKKQDESHAGYAYSEIVKNAKENDTARYGAISVNDGQNVIEAIDAYGNKCEDALMLAIPVKDKVTYDTTVLETTKSSKKNKEGDAKKIKIPKSGKDDKKTITCNTLVWYDNTAMINVSSDRNIIFTQVQGRDYSRKELISNGDIRFTVTGRISSGMADVFPETQYQKFVQIMRYKGIVKVNNQILDQHGIDGLVIKDWNISSKEGCKSVQKYSFSAVGVMPKSEIKVIKDTIYKIDKSLITIKRQSKWERMLNKKLKGVTNSAINSADMGLSVASGMLL